jgi:hypothetical protein
MNIIKKIDVLYYSRKELIKNSSIYYPSKKENSDPLDISYLEQVKADAYNECDSKVGVVLALNNFRRNISDDSTNTGIVTIKTDKGIISYINAYSVGTNVIPYLRDGSILFTKALYVSGEYANNGINDVYIKIIGFKDIQDLRKIEIFY